MLTSFFVMKVIGQKEKSMVSENEGRNQKLKTCQYDEDCLCAFMVGRVFAY